MVALPPTFSMDISDRSGPCVNWRLLVALAANFGFWSVAAAAVIRMA